MIRSLLTRLRQGHRTIAFPQGPCPEMAERFRGRPVLDVSRCPDGCRDCAAACPTDALRLDPEPRVDLGRCLFCADCAGNCPAGAITHDRDFRLSTRSREDLVVPARPSAIPLPGLAQALEQESRRLFGRSLRLRQVSAGGCNGCEVEAAVLGTLAFDLGRFGVQFVASPRHADGLLITGPVTENMKLALRKTWEAVPGPRLVIASGACAISGGPYLDHPETASGAGAMVPIDLHVPGCPPHPLTLLDGILRLLGRMPDQRSAGASPPTG